MKRLLVVLVLLAACSSNGSPQPTTTAPVTTALSAPAEAVAVCQAAVKDKLVSPDGARFNQQAANTAGSSWQFRGTVDADNGAGVVKHIDYSCLVNPSGEQWIIGDVTVSPG